MNVCRTTPVFALALALAVPAWAAGPLRPGQPAPQFVLNRAPAGTLALAQLRGKPVYLSFFASWCTPCAQEAPYIGRLATKYASRGLVTLGIDELEDADRALDFANRNQLPFPVLIDADGAMGQSYGSIGLPMHVFIDRNGRVSTWRAGQMSEAQIEAAIKKIV